jgi:hypothetical protein
LQNISGTVIGFGLLVFLSTLPLLFNFADVKWYAKILMLLGSLYALSFLLILPAIFTEATKSNKWLLFFSPLFAFFIVGIISYFNFELWGHKSLALGVLFTWTMFVGLFLSIKALFNRTLGSENTPIVLIAMAILTLFIAVVNEKTSNNLSADLYYKISVGIVYLIAIALYANRYIYKQKNEHKVISNIIGIIFWGAIITISFPFYIQWCGLTGDDFNTFVSVYAAVLGGGITLAGVAWTIKDNSEKNKQERKLSIKPYLDVRYKCFSDITELPSKDILTIELGKIVVIQPTISNAINDLFILRSRTSGIEERLAPAVYALELARFTSSHMMVYTEIENCGAGNAIDVKLKFNGNEITSFCITTSTPKQILFVFKDELLGEEKEEYTKINLSFEYTDVASFGRYKQDESFIFGRNTSDELYVSQMQEDLLTPPVEI